MPWQLVNPKYYAASLSGGAGPRAALRGFGLHGSGDVHGHERALWFQDTSAREHGELVLHVDEAGELDWFQLTHTRWPHGQEHVAEWKRGTALHLGAVAGEGSGEGAAGYRAASPTITRYGTLPREILLEMTDYFLKNAEAVEEAIREEVARVLWGAMHAPPR